MLMWWIKGQAIGAGAACKFSISTWEPCEEAVKGVVLLEEDNNVFDQPVGWGVVIRRCPVLTAREQAGACEESKL